MKALVYDRYGPPSVLGIRDVERPTLEHDDVLVQVRAASVNSWDWDRLTGTPLLYRGLSGWLAPKQKVLGADVAGRVAAVGSSVTRFAVGDDVFGDLSAGDWGAFAEYARAKENAVVRKPPRLSFEEAAAFPQAAVLALQGIADYGQVRSGANVLINGAGGGVGTFAVQLAKARGAIVTAVDSAPKLGKLRALGADHTIDYTQDDFASHGQRYDLILDMVANRSIAAIRRCLAPTGSYVVVGGRISSILASFVYGYWCRIRGSRQRLSILIHQPNKELTQLAELFEAGKLQPVIDRCYPLDEAPEALRRLGAGHVLGKVVVTVKSDG